MLQELSTIAMMSAGCSLFSASCPRPVQLESTPMPPTPEEPPAGSMPLPPVLKPDEPPIGSMLPPAPFPLAPPRPPLFDVSVPPAEHAVPAPVHASASKAPLTNHRNPIPLIAALYMVHARALQGQTT